MLRGFRRTDAQQYDVTGNVSEIRRLVDAWRKLPNPNSWGVTPETQRLLQHWRSHEFSSFRPFFCQVEAAETVIWLTEVAPGLRETGRQRLDYLANASQEANPELVRWALKMATGAGKTTVMAMLIAWQTINAVRHRKNSNQVYTWVLGRCAGDHYQGPLCGCCNPMILRVTTRVASWFRATCCPTLSVRRDSDYELSRVHVARDDEFVIWAIVRCLRVTTTRWRRSRPRVRW